MSHEPSGYCWQPGRSSLGLGRLFAAAAFLFTGVFAIFIVGLILGNALYVDRPAIEYLFESEFIADALWLSLWTSTVTTLIALIFAVPMGYALSRYRFPGRMLMDTLVDLPIVFPPLVAGLTLLVFFHQTAVGKWIQSESRSRAALRLRDPRDCAVPVFCGRELRHSLGQGCL